MSGKTRLFACLIMLVFFASAASAAVPGTLKVMNPRPSRAPIDAVALAPRLNSLEGKTVAVIANYNESMPPIARTLLDAAPGIKVIYISDLVVAAGQSPRPIELEQPITNMFFRDFEANPSVADALVFGNGF